MSGVNTPATMTLAATSPSTRWPAKATALWSAWVNVTKKAPPNYNALRMILAQAEAETNCGDVWQDPAGVPSRCWGACDLRALNTNEKQAFADGVLRIGAFLHADGSWSEMHSPGSQGTLRGDSDPNTGAFKVWFAVFDSDAAGAAYMLRTGVRGSVDQLSDPTCSAATYAASLYVNQCYYGGVHAGARPCGKRALPLNVAEQKNVDDYTTFISKHFPAIDAGLQGWAPPGAYAEPPETIITDLVTEGPVNGGVETGEAAGGGEDT
jgi:hypothetical protein